MRKRSLKWYAFKENSAYHKLEAFNALSLIENDLEAKVKSGLIYNKDDLKDAIRDLLRRAFLTNNNYELVICITDNEDEFTYKIDVWYQLEPNLDRIVEYVNNVWELGL